MLIKLRTKYITSKSYVTKTVSDPSVPMRVWEPAHGRALKLGYRFRSFDPASRALEMRLVYQLSTRIFRKNPFYVDVSEQEFAELYGREAGRLDAEFFVFVLDPQGEPVGFLFAMPDRVQHETLNIKTMGTLPRVHGTGMGAALTMEVYRRGISRGFSIFRHCLMRAGNEADRMDRGGARVTREYALYSRSVQA